jgi:hypothetical protein
MSFTNSRVYAARHPRTMGSIPHSAAHGFHDYCYAMKHNRSHHNEKPASPVESVSAVDLTRTGVDFVPSPDEVARKAYFTYVNEGSPLGRHVQHWLDAEAQLIAERNLTRVHGFRN